MPGLTQLEKFSEKLLTLGNEPEIRSSNGEPRPLIPMPAGITDTDDSDDFIFGLPGSDAREKEPFDADDTDENTDSVTDDFFNSLGINNEPEPQNTAGLDDDPLAGLSAAEPDFSDLPASLPDISDDFSLDDLSLPDFPQTEAIPADDTASDFDLSPDFDTATDLTPPGDDELDMTVGFEEAPVASAVNAQSGAAEEELSDGLGADAELSALLDNVENMFDLPDSDSSEPAEVDDFDEPTAEPTPDFSLDDEFTKSSFGSDLETPGSGEENELPEFDLSNMDFDTGADPVASSDISDLPDFDTDNAMDFSPEGLEDSVFSDDLPSADSLPSLDDLHSSINTDPMEEAMDFSIPDEGPAPAAALNEEGLPDSLADFDFSGMSGEEPSNDSAENTDFSFDFELPLEESKKQTASDAVSENSLEEKSAEPNEFTAAAYKRFLENLQVYPLNVRIALEEIIVENQFTDEAVADLIRQVIKKIPPRQLAAHLSKLTDKSITVPRDFEKRTAEQYASYKQSIEYQLKNRVLPALCIIVASLGLGILFGFLINTFVYRPLRAELLYSQGYKLLESEAFQQAGQKFNEAVSFKPKMNWFLRYADGYRIRKQFERARQVFESGLLVFSNNKRLGLAYANMELYDLANYAQAEKIVRRNILDFYINDKDGLLLLGDVFLEWATEKDPQKFEDARQQYAQLMSLYGQTDVYLSRMMRYFVRTDNLREVLPLKAYFLPKKKALGASDLVELSGYLLDKLYGPLDPTEEYLRAYIEDVRTLLERAVDADPSMPEAHYNFGKYFLHTRNSAAAKNQFAIALSTFDTAVPRNSRRVVKNIDAFRYLGDLHLAEENYIDAEQMYARGIEMYQKEKDISALAPNPVFGQLYASLGDIDYFISGDYDTAFENYLASIKNMNDLPEIRYKVGYIQYGRQNYQEALGSFISAAAGKPADRSVLFSLGNVLFLRNDDYAAQGYYERLLQLLEADRARMGVIFPQVSEEQGDLVSAYMKASNNLGATLYRVARRSGDSSKNAGAMVHFSESVRARDALTRNQTTMVRLEGTDLAAQNLKYSSFPMPAFQPGIYTEIPPVMTGDRVLRQSSLGK